MSRVTKKFLIKLAPIAIGVVYTWIALELGGFVSERYGDPLYGLFTIGFMVIGPMVIYMLRETWLQAKREVEYENELMINTLKDS